MYTQNAIVCGSPGTNLLGVSHDVSSLVGHLKSPFGGAFGVNNTDEVWSDDDLQYSSLISRFDAIKPNQKYDYFLFYFSGHGYTNPENVQDLRIIVGNGKGGECYISAHKIVHLVQSISNKSVLIFDCCRTIPHVPKFSLGDKLSLITESISSSGLTHDMGRKLFSEQVNRCPNGSAALLSCSLNEYSMDSPYGGEYTRALIDETYKWVEFKDNSKVLPLGHTFTEQMQRYYDGKTYTQTPTFMYTDERMLGLPFAVK